MSGLQSMEVIAALRITTTEVQISKLVLIGGTMRQSVENSAKRFYLSLVIEDDGVEMMVGAAS